MTEPIQPEELDLDTEAIARDLAFVLQDMAERHRPTPGELMIVGCSTSEVQGRRIGKSSSPDVASALYPVLVDFANAYGLRLAFQCCEHLNRAVVLRRQTAKEERLYEVAVVPHPTAGGSMAAHAYRAMTDAVVVEDIDHLAGYGIDIGLTMIGMHMRPVVVPMRLAHKTVGEAVVQCAYSRAKLIGGERARYEP